MIQPAVIIVTALSAWQAQTVWPDGKIILQSATFALLLTAGWITLDIVITAYLRWRKIWQTPVEAQTRHAETLIRMGQMIVGMTDEQLAAYGRQRVTIETVTSNVTPLYTLVLPFARVPWDFVVEFIQQGTPGYLAPIRRYSEGSDRREWAEALTKYFVEDGYAAPAVGNEPARWLRRNEALISVGMDG